MRKGKSLYTKDLEKYILSSIIKAEKETSSYRYLIYDVLKAGPSSYVSLQLAGLLDFHNKFHDDPNFFNDYELDFSSKEKYFELSEDERIEILSYVIFLQGF